MRGPSAGHAKDNACKARRTVIEPCMSRVVLRARYAADEDVVVGLAPALGFKSPGIEAGCHQLHRGLSDVADSDDFAVPRNPVATASDLLVRFVVGIYEDAGTGMIRTFGCEVLHSGVLSEESEVGRHFRV